MCFYLPNDFLSCAAISGNSTLLSQWTSGPIFVKCSLFFKIVFSLSDKEVLLAVFNPFMPFHFRRSLALRLGSWAPGTSVAAAQTWLRQLSLMTSYHHHLLRSPSATFSAHLPLPPPPPPLLTTTFSTHRLLSPLTATSSTH